MILLVCRCNSKYAPMLKKGRRRLKKDTKPVVNIFLRVMLCLFASCVAFGQTHANSADERSWLNLHITPADARHLLARTGLDAAHESQHKIAGLTRQEAIDFIIAGFETSPSIPMPAWTEDTAPLYWTRRDLDEAEQRQFDRLRDSELSELRHWWIDEMLVTPSPQTERMVLFWHDHFATSYHGIGRQSIAMARQNQTFRKMGMGDLESLLKAMIRDPALLKYLNNTSNKQRKPNENLARELLELFTLGEGNYEEATVREAARALTGYTVSMNNNLQSRFNYWQHDSNPKTLFGETGNFNGDDLITLIMKQPALDRYMAARYWHWLVTDREPRDDEIQPLADSFRASGHQLGELYRNTLESKAFWHADNRGGLIKSPATLLLGTARTLGYGNGINRQLPKLLKLSGQDLFAPPNVAGWQEGAAWITPGRLLNRYAALKQILSATQNTQAMGTESDKALSMNTNTRNDMGMSMGMGVSTGMGMGMGMNPDSDTAAANSLPNVTLQLAAEEYQGAARYRVELLDANLAVTWSSGEHELASGWDTVRYGMVESRDQLPWRDILLPIESQVFASGDRLRVHFVNDAAGTTGDRNLYVGTLQHNQASTFPLPGSQSSECPQPNAADAGDLYCAGYVDFDVQALRSMAAFEAQDTELDDSAVKDTIRYASKHIEWANKNTLNGNSNVRIVFQDVRFGQRHWPVFTAWYRIIGNNEPVLWLHNQDCWSDCLEVWPSCAWSNLADPTGRTIAISSTGVKDEQTAICHVAGLNDDEAAMVDGLLLQGRELLKDALQAETLQYPVKRAGIKAGLSSLIENLNSVEVQAYFAQHTPTARTEIDAVPLWVQSDTAKRAYRQDLRVRDLPTPARELIERHAQIINAGFTMPAVLAPGIPLSDLPGWTASTDLSSTRAQLRQQTRRWLLNPAYQVH